MILAGIAAVVLFALCSSVNAADSVKVLTGKSGFYRVAASNIAEILSITETQAASTDFRVLNMGLEVASARDGGDVIFYAHEYEGPHTDKNVYWIEQGTPSPVPALNVGSGFSPFEEFFFHINRYEDHQLVRTDLVFDETEDPILWRMLTSGLVTKKYTTVLNLDAVEPGSAGGLIVRMKGATEISGRYYHRVRVDLNGSTLGYMDFEGLETAEVYFPVTPGQWLNGANTVTVESTPPPGTFFDSVILDYLEADYDRDTVAVNGQIEMPVLGSSVELRGFGSSQVRVWDVTDPWGVRALSGQGIAPDGSMWKVQLDTTEYIELAASESGAEHQPVMVLPGSSVDLKNLGWQVDHLVISCPLLVNAADDITAYRAGQGLDSLCITVDDIYDAFNYGIRDGRAIERFLNFAYRNWSKHPRYVLLVGDGSIDFKNQMGYNDSRIPATKLIGPNGLYASDYVLGDPTDGGIIEMAVGRLPFITETEVYEYISKMIQYETGGDWRTNKLIATDQNDYGGDFLNIGNQLSQLIDGNVFRGDLTTQDINTVRAAVINGINEGREVSTYVGHGTPNQLSSQNILLSSDLNSLTNDAHPTTFVAIGCLIGAFNDPGKVNLGEGMLEAQGGAASVAAAATLISAGDGQVLTEAFLDELYFFDTDRVGDAWIVGKNELTYAFRHPAFKAFQLMGDPALAVGSVTAPRQGNGGPSVPGFFEWAETITPPVLEDMGYFLFEEGDEDGDELTNYDEYKAGTDPFDSGSVIEIIRIRRPASGIVELSWPSAAGRTYTIESAPSAFGPFVPMLTGVPATAPLNVKSFAEDMSEPHAYRVIVE